MALKCFLKLDTVPNTQLLLEIIRLTELVHYTPDGVLYTEVEKGFQHLLICNRCCFVTKDSEIGSTIEKGFFGWK